jgi:hypothetical protein
MISKRQAALAYEMQSRGIDYGQTIARLAIEQFPDGFDDEAGEGMQQIVKTAITSTLDKFAAGGARPDPADQDHLSGQDLCSMPREKAPGRRRIPERYSCEAP